MSKVILDGFILGPNGETDWCIMDADMAFRGFLSTMDSIFCGPYPLVYPVGTDRSLPHIGTPDCNGKRKTLFEDPKKPIALELVATNVFRSGVVQLIYKP